MDAGGWGCVGDRREMLGVGVECYNRARQHQISAPSEHGKKAGRSHSQTTFFTLQRDAAAKYAINSSKKIQL